MADEQTSAGASLEALLEALPEEELDLTGGAALDDEPVDEAPGDEEEEEQPEEEPAEEEEPSQSIFDLAQAEGVDLSGYSDEQQAIRSLLHAKKLVGQRNELAEWGKAIQENPQQVYEVLKNFLGVQEQQAPKDEVEKEVTSDDPDVSAYLKLKKAEPAWDDDWENQLTQDENGKVVAAPDAEPGLLSKIAAHRRWKAKVADFIVKKPGAVMKAEGAGVSGPADKEVKELKAKLAQFEQANQQQAVQRFGFEVAAANKDWMFKDGVIRQGNLTPAGEMFCRTFDNLVANSPNHKNPQLLVDAARSMVIAQLNAQKPKAKAKPTEPADETDDQRSLRERMNGVKGKGTRTAPLSASAQGRGRDSRKWPQRNGQDISLAEALNRALGKK